MAWRDRQILRAFALLNGSSMEVRKSYEDLLNEASFLDSAWDPPGFANHRVDRLFREKLVPPLAEFFREAGDELSAIDARLKDLGAIFAEGPEIEYPEAPLPPPSEESEPPKDEASEKPDSASENWFSRVGKTVSGTAEAVVGFASETADWLVQDKVGLRNRLRYAAAERIVKTWMGDLGKPAPVLSQIVMMIEVAANEARVTTS